MALSSDPKYIRIKQAVERYSLSRSTIYRAIDKGELTPVKKGKCLLFSIEELDRWIMSDSIPAA